ncbi:hypothetical protein EJB05_13042 [Eragrostis curvula]|uniref:Uncharacterized protein n=1 Tax=Eragrostis curvula TaxID=38414 RepID=A0A5J9VVJ1_9POAL|nr:hypothetical protein EJB05_13042 [Eragrostis curvula]
MRPCGGVREEVDDRLKDWIRGTRRRHSQHAQAHPRISLQDHSPLEAGLVFVPHSSSDDLLPTIASSAMQWINGEEKHRLHSNITLQQMEEIMLPKAIDYFRKNTEASVYQILWKSEHGSAYFDIVKAGMNTRSTRRVIRGGSKGKLLKREGKDLEIQTDVIPHFIDLWVAHAPIRLQGSISDWIQKEKENKSAPPYLKLA